MTAFLWVDYKSCPACLGHEIAGSLGRGANQGVIKVCLSFTFTLAGRRGPSGTHAQKKEETGWLGFSSLWCNDMLPVGTILKSIELQPSGWNAIGFGFCFFVGFFFHIYWLFWSINNFSFCSAIYFLLSQTSAGNHVHADFLSSLIPSFKVPLWWNANNWTGLSPKICIRMHFET